MILNCCWLPADLLFNNTNRDPSRLKIVKFNWNQFRNHFCSQVHIKWLSLFFFWSHHFLSSFFLNVIYCPLLFFFFWKQWKLTSHFGRCWIWLTIPIICIGWLFCVLSLCLPLLWDQKSLVLNCCQWSSMHQKTGILTCETCWSNINDLL